MSFIKGMDVSMVKELEEHGAKYYLNGEKKDLFEILKECGVNLIRLRLWNDPYSTSGEAYGGGTNDIDTTIELAKRILSHDMEFMLDFHYSDFWADPAKQYKPKAWENLSGSELETAVYHYTIDTLSKLKEKDVLPSVVQIGNEITNGLLWPDGKSDNTEGMASLLKAGISAVKEFDPNIKILLHLDFGTDNEMYRKWFTNIAPYDLEFDIIGMSYYPYWNGSIEDLVQNMNDISQTFQKDVLVAETAIGYTTDSLGCNGLVFSEEMEKKAGFPATKAGQEQFLKELCDGIRKVKNHRGIGIIYWEAAWLPIPECSWAHSIGCEYMNDTAEVGNSWANQALFDEKGNANQALVNMKNW
ncbi:arabinogalactan endo-1,4-beta-galactosidase [Anaerotaenia torta]|uniref:glycoside hydrolase family 53 protein n=1 Tax=Anaerotaenia torta TaxID=433293 RepID=UPI003D2125D8